MKCSHCSSPDTVWKPKVGKWECRACEERFEGDAPAAAPVAASPVPPRAARPLRIFFSYGHDHNRELVDRYSGFPQACREIFPHRDALRSGGNSRNSSSEKPSLR